MGRKPKKSRHPNSTHFITLGVTGAEKNKLIDKANALGMPLSEFLRYIVWEFVKSEKSLPPAPAVRPRPTPDDALRAYLSGEKLLMPCGKELCDMNIKKFGGGEYCDTCGLRVF